MKERVKRLLYIKPQNGMHFLGPPIGRNRLYVSHLYPKKGLKKTPYDLERTSQQLLCCEGDYDSVVVFSTSPTQAKSKQLNKARH